MPNKSITPKLGENPQDQTGVPSHRAALKSIVSVAGLGLCYGQLPVQWVKPVVNSVIIPAHAQTSISIGNNPVPPCGSSVSLNTMVTILFTISPNPGDGAIASVDTSCNGSPSTSGTFTIPCDANGNVSLSATGLAEACSVGDVLSITLSYGGATSSCGWVMT